MDEPLLKHNPTVGGNMLLVWKSMGMVKAGQEEEKQAGGEPGCPEDVTSSQPKAT